MVLASWASYGDCQRGHDEISPDGPKANNDGEVVGIEGEKGEWSSQKHKESCGFHLTSKMEEACKGIALLQVLQLPLDSYQWRHGVLCRIGFITANHLRIMLNLILFSVDFSLLKNIPL